MEATLNTFTRNYRNKEMGRIVFGRVNPTSNTIEQGIIIFKMDCRAIRDHGLLDVATIPLVPALGSTESSINTFNTPESSNENTYAEWGFVNNFLIGELCPENSTPIFL